MPKTLSQKTKIGKSNLSNLTSDFFDDVDSDDDYYGGGNSNIFIGGDNWQGKSNPEVESSKLIEYYLSTLKTKDAKKNSIEMYRKL